ncbi:MAG: SGNH/GDSL hydrolase family protein, partial [Phycisphaerae bacterium]|nr:SGNH/GDSL hydrolase family protein [Phycisphaerae bacterium]
SGNILAGKTSTSLTDSTPTAGTEYYYKCVATDGASATAASNEIPASTSKAALTIGIVSDSTFVIQPYDGTANIGAKLPAAMSALGYGSVTIVNEGSSGTKSGDWLDGGTLEGYANTAFTATPPNIIVIHLGVNDANNNVSAATFGSNLQNIVTWCKRYAAKIVIDTPQAAEPSNADAFAADGTNALLVSYIPYISALIDNATVFSGADAFGMTARNTYTRMDGIHFAELGANQFAGAVAHAITQAIVVPQTTYSLLRDIDWGTTGASLHYQVIDNGGAVRIARTTTGIAERPSGSGQYQVYVALNTGWGDCTIIWDDGTSYTSEAIPSTTPLIAAKLPSRGYLAGTSNATGAIDAADVTAIQSGLSKPGTAQTITDTAAAQTAQTTIAAIAAQTTAAQQQANVQAGLTAQGLSSANVSDIKGQVDKIGTTAGAIQRNITIITG